MPPSLFCAENHAGKRTALTVLHTKRELSALFKESVEVTFGQPLTLEHSLIYNLDTTGQYTDAKGGDSC
jgi:hypothetical protein